MGKPPGFTADQSLADRRGRYSNIKHYRPPKAASGLTLPSSWVQLSQDVGYGGGGTLVDDEEMETDAEDVGVGTDDEQDSFEGDAESDEGSGEAVTEEDDDIGDDIA